MSKRRHLFWAWFTVVVASGLGAQTRSEAEAVALLTRVGEELAARPHLEVTGYTRELRAEEMQDAESPTPVYRVAGAEYRRLVLTFRRPDRWRIVSHGERIVRGQAQASRTFVFGGTEAGESAMLLLNPSTQATSRISIPEGMFKQEVNDRLGEAISRDAIFGLLVKGVFRADPVRWALFHGGNAEARIEGTEEVNGVRLTRIATSWPSTSVTRLWIDTESSRLVRILEAPSQEGFRFFRGAEIRIKETIYHYDFSKGAADADFDLPAGWALATPNIASDAGFSSSTELFAALTSGGRIVPDVPVANAPAAPKTPPAAPPAQTPRRVGPRVPPTAAAPSEPAPPPASLPEVKPPVEEQLLNAEQMQAIVLIEGADGVGSGFVARIRDVDFVVTNQHVIGGNDRLRVTTLGGAVLKVGATFGARGRDVALLRIDGSHTGPVLKLAEDPVKTVKIGDKVAVVGNRRGGGVATQVSGVVRGIGPDRIEVDAPFQPGNSGSPILHLASGEVIGLATYSQTRTLDLLDGPTEGASGAAAKSDQEKTEQRWFGYRADGISNWEGIDLAKWRAQAKRISDFESDSNAIYHAMRGRFKQAYSNPRVRMIIDRFEARISKVGQSEAAVMQEVPEFFRGLRALADSGTRELEEGDFYDYFRSSLYWETSIPQQLSARQELARRLDTASDNATGFLAQLRR